MIPTRVTEWVCNGPMCMTLNIEYLPGGVRRFFMIMNSEEHEISDEHIDGLFPVGTEQRATIDLLRIDRVEFTIWTIDPSSPRGTQRPYMVTEVNPMTGEHGLENALRFERVEDALAFVQETPHPRSEVGHGVLHWTIKASHYLR